jgi:hypothetical protein
LKGWFSTIVQVLEGGNRVTEAWQAFAFQTEEKS